MYSLLIFDWDGTVIDSTARIVSSMQSAARELGLRSLQNHEAQEIIGLGLPEAVQALFPGIDDVLLEAVRDRYVHHYMDADNTPVALFPGVQRTLERLHEKGYRLAVATGKSRKGLDRVLADTGLGWLFEITRCADETTSKPHPHMLEEILSQTQVDVSNAVMIGDTEFDLKMGVQAGMDTIAVSYGAHHIDRLKQYNPVLEMHAFPELETWLDLKSGERV
ncbi:HAD family hydrolase [Neptunomonas antarctica]|uniref:Phosphoglycolate phosphatase n=1 Tax=Neptunomonas antarctica TaxID=619304 RepID=A0A1N7PK10_9GAMM|nr:HAD-IIIA family hydrolase [Neptunomonas antarctica]SIT10820.1 phosphoglycolate phosphatase [Neptunomonas antarctica]